MSVGRPWPAPDVVAGYHLADGNDFSGNSKTLTNNGTTTFVVDGFDNCANFVYGSSQFLRRAAAIVATDAAFTVLLNLKITSSPSNGTSYRILTLADNSGGCEYVVIWYANSNGTCLFHVEPGSLSHYSYDIELMVDKWYQLAYVNAGAYTATTYLYLNGALVASGANGNNNAGVSTTLVGGGTFGEVTKYSTCRIDELVVLNRAMSAAEIRRWCGFRRGLLV